MVAAPLQLIARVSGSAPREAQKHGADGLSLGCVARDGQLLMLRLVTDAAIADDRAADSSA